MSGDQFTPSVKDLWAEAGLMHGLNMWEKMLQKPQSLTLPPGVL